MYDKNAEFCIAGSNICFVLYVRIFSCDYSDNDPFEFDKSRSNDLGFLKTYLCLSIEEFVRSHEHIVRVYRSLKRFPISRSVLLFFLPKIGN